MQYMYNMKTCCSNWKYHYRITYKLYIRDTCIFYTNYGLKESYCSEIVLPGTYQRGIFWLGLGGFLKPSLMRSDRQWTVSAPSSCAIQWPSPPPSSSVAQWFLWHPYYNLGILVISSWIFWNWFLSRIYNKIIKILLDTVELKINNSCFPWSVIWLLNQYK